MWTLTLKINSWLSGQKCSWSPTTCVHSQNSQKPRSLQQAAGLFLPLLAFCTLTFPSVTPSLQCYSFEPCVWKSQWSWCKLRIPLSSNVLLCSVSLPSSRLPGSRRPTQCLFPICFYHWDLQTESLGLTHIINICNIFVDACQKTLLFFKPEMYYV